MICYGSDRKQFRAVDPVLNAWGKMGNKDTALPLWVRSLEEKVGADGH